MATGLENPTRLAWWRRVKQRCGACDVCGAFGTYDACSTYGAYGAYGACGACGVYTKKVQLTSPYHLG